MIIQDKSGGRTVELFIPYEHMGKKVDKISFPAFRYGHTLRWNKGDWKTSFAMMVELSGMEEELLKELRYPDTDRVMSTFLDMLPLEIRNDIMEGRIPTKEMPPPQEIRSEDDAPHIGRFEPPQKDPGIDFGDAD